MFLNCGLVALVTIRLFKKVVLLTFLRKEVTRWQAGFNIRDLLTRR